MFFIEISYVPEGGQLDCPIEARINPHHIISIRDWAPADDRKYCQRTGKLVKGCHMRIAGLGAVWVSGFTATELQQLAEARLSEMATPLRPMRGGPREA